MEAAVPPNYGRAVEFNGELYLWQQETVYKYNSGTGNWDVQSSPSNLLQSIDGFGMDTTAGYAYHAGWHIMDISGTPNLVCAYASQNARTWVLRFDGTTWTRNQLNHATYYRNYGDCIVYRNTFFIATNNAVLQWDPENDTSAVYTPALLSAGVFSPSWTFVILNNELYLLGWQGSSSANQVCAIWRFSAGAFTKVQNVAAGASTIYSTGLNSGWVCRAWEDGTNIFVLFKGGTLTTSNSGWFLAKLTPSGSTFTSTDLTSSVVPSALQEDNGIGTLYSSWYVVKDNDTDPTSPDVYFWYSQDDNSGSILYYYWQGESTTLGSGSTVANYGLAMPSENRAAGPYNWSSGELHIEIVGRSQGTGGLTLSFKVYGGGTGKTAKFYYSMNEETPTSQCTLTGSATGGSATRSGNTVTNISADGSTAYTITWDFFTDGAALGEYFTVMPYIE